MTPRPIELLAPARNADIAIEAIRHGADAVYIGAASHGARSAAANSLDDLRRVVEFAHRFNARLYATVNTLVYDSELKAVETLIHDLYRIGVDALIVQDLGVLRMDIPPIALHASTQCDIRTPQKARFLQDAGFSQLVLPRELSIDETREIARSVEVPLEVFVHGALCVSYSGDCQASFMVNGRSANRGECAQICRLPFDLIDGDGREVIRRKHLLSLRDLNRSGRMVQLLEAGVSSFKIEGRLKDAAYVKNTVAAYRRIIDGIIDSAPGRYCRSSSGEISTTFVPDLSKSFNRGYTEYFTSGSAPAIAMASFDTPKWQGRPVGKITGRQGNALTARLREGLSNGDGLGFIDRSGRFSGFRLNRVEGNRLFPAEQIDIPAGTVIYRNKDKAWDDTIGAAVTACRRIPVGIVLRIIPRGIAIDLSDPDGNAVSVSLSCELQKARTSQYAQREATLSKLGDTIFTVSSITDLVGDMFVPLSALSALRRTAFERLLSARAINYRYDYRRPSSKDLKPFTDSPLTRHDNVANAMAARFYKEAGFAIGEPAIETSRPKGKDRVRVMTTRYCLRRELGRCLMTPEGKELKGPLTLRSGNSRFGLDFDCRNCRMYVDWLA